MEAYCMKCKTKREMQDPVASFNAKASPVTIGVCAVCGTKLYRMGKTEAHEGMPPPPKFGGTVTNTGGFRRVSEGETADLSG